MMKTTLFVAFFVTVGAAAILDNPDGETEKLDPQQARLLLSNDFEEGMRPWYDSSTSQIHWLLESIDEPLEETPAPQPGAGTKYLRVVRPSAGIYGTAVLRSPVFTALPGDQFSFSFWIRSKHFGTNNLEVYWVVGGREQLLLSLSQYSSPTNYEWYTVSAPIPATVPTDSTIIIYGYVSSNVEDAIAIDDIVVGSSETTTTTSPETTTTGVSCPPHMNSDVRVPCWELLGRCYCFGIYNVSSWDEADAACKSADMKLISVETAEEDNTIRNHILAEPGLPDDPSTDIVYYTSGKNLNGRFVWTSTGEYFYYTNWGPGKPNGDFVRICVDFHSQFNLAWADVVCSSNCCPSSHFYFICES